MTGLLSRPSRWLVLAVVAVLGANDRGRSAPSTNLLANGRFDRDLRGWSATTLRAEWSDGAVKIVNKSFQHALPGITSNSVTIWQCVRVMPGRRYDLRARTRTDVPAIGRGYGAATVDWFTTRNCTVGRHGSRQINTITTTKDAAADAQWHDVSLTVVAPSASRSAIVSLDSVVTDMTVGDFVVWFDDAMFTQRDE